MFQALNAHHQEANCIDAVPGIVTLSKWPFSAQAEREICLSASALNGQ